MKPYKQPVNATYGAPMGRHSDNPANFDGLSVTLSAVHLIDGYDDGGAYWGIGTPLFCAIGESDEEQLIHYFRQPNRAAAVTYLENYGAIVVPESPDEYLETMTGIILLPRCGPLLKTMVPPSMTITTPQTLTPNPASAANKNVNRS